MDEISTVNIFLYNQKLAEDHFIIRELYSSSNKKEKIFDTGTNAEKYKRVQHHLQILLENLHFKNKSAKWQGVSLVRFEISVYLSSVINGDRQERLLKTYSEIESVYNVELLSDKELMMFEKSDISLLRSRKHR